VLENKGKGWKSLQLDRTKSVKRFKKKAKRNLWVRGYGVSVWGRGGERGRLPKLFLRDNYSDGYSSVELQIRECSLYGGCKSGKWVVGGRNARWVVGGRNARLEECKSIFFSLFIFTGNVLR
jgi:hypothetical protein